MNASANLFSMGSRCCLISISSICPVVALIKRIFLNINLSWANFHLQFLKAS